MVYSILVIVQVVVALTLVGLILVQHGKGADAGAAFGSGASGTVFGAKGSANFMSRATAALATVFFVASLALAYLVTGASTVAAGSGSVTDQLTQPTASQSASKDASNAGAPAAGSAESGSKASSAPAPSKADKKNDGNSDSSPKIPE